MDDIFLLKIFQYIVIIISAVFHEYAHGLIAYKLGDPTAKYDGRLTLNPFVHIELFGTVLLPLFMLFTVGGFAGWAKPVPYNPYNLKGRYGSLKVAIAGPGTNLLIALGLALLLRLFTSGGADIFSSLQLLLLAYITYINIYLALFNLLPFPPLDGSKIFLDLFPRQWESVMQLGFMGLVVAVIVAIYILPVLAGSVFWLFTGFQF